MDRVIWPRGASGVDEVVFVDSSVGSMSDVVVIVPGRRASVAKERVMLCDLDVVCELLKPLNRCFAGMAARFEAIVPPQLAVERRCGGRSCVLMMSSCDVPITTPSEVSSFRRKLLCHDL